MGGGGSMGEMPIPIHGDRWGTLDECGVERAGTNSIKSRLSPFANTRVQSKRKEGKDACTKPSAKKKKKMSNFEGDDFPDYYEEDLPEEYDPDDEENKDWGEYGGGYSDDDSDSDSKDDSDSDSKDDSDKEEEEEDKKDDN
ncbi:hypothetical protein QYF36_026217 [Acer negundo]|nr:hypothetical protein QYF36_026217 [Acer negundo]